PRPGRRSGAARDLPVAAGLDGEGLGHLSARIGDEPAVEVHGDVAAAAGVDVGGRGIADVLVDDRAVDLAAAAAAPHGEAVDRVDDPAHAEAAGDVDPARHHDHSAEDPARVAFRVALDVDVGDVRCRGGVGSVLVDILPTDRVDVDDAVRQLVAGVEGQASDGGAAEVGAVGLGHGLEAVEIPGLQHERAEGGVGDELLDVGNAGSCRLVRV